MTELLYMLQVLEAKKLVFSQLTSSRCTRNLQPLSNGYLRC